MTNRFQQQQRGETERSVRGGGGGWGKGGRGWVWDQWLLTGLYSLFIFQILCRCNKIYISTLVLLHVQRHSCEDVLYSLVGKTVKASQVASYWPSPCVCVGGGVTGRFCVQHSQTHGHGLSYVFQTKPKGYSPPLLPSRPARSCLGDFFYLTFFADF